MSSAHSACFTSHAAHTPRAIAVRAATGRHAEGALSSLFEDALSSHVEAKVEHSVQVERRTAAIERSLLNSPEISRTHSARVRSMQAVDENLLPESGEENSSEECTLFGDHKQFPANASVEEEQKREEENTSDVCEATGDNEVQALPGKNEDLLARSLVLQMTLPQHCQPRRDSNVQVHALSRVNTPTMVQGSELAAALSLPASRGGIGTMEEVYPPADDGAVEVASGKEATETTPPLTRFQRTHDGDSQTPEELNSGSSASLDIEAPSLPAGNLASTLRPADLRTANVERKQEKQSPRREQVGVVSAGEILRTGAPGPNAGLHADTQAVRVAARELRTHSQAQGQSSEASNVMVQVTARLTDPTLHEYSWHAPSPAGTKLTPKILVGVQDAGLGDLRIQAEMDERGSVRLGLVGQSDSARESLLQIEPLLHAALMQHNETHHANAEVHIVQSSDGVSSRAEQKPWSSSLSNGQSTANHSHHSHRRQGSSTRESRAIVGGNLGRGLEPSVVAWQPVPVLPSASPDSGMLSVRI